MNIIEIPITKDIKKQANIAARARGYGRATSIVFGPVTKPKILSAHSYYYETRGGTRIYHPSAYAKSGWSNMVYVNAECEVMLPRIFGGEVD